MKKLLLTVFLLTASTVYADTFYISPTGSDGGAGTTGDPWETFAFALPQLNPGDTLILKNGTYTGANSGFPAINCSTTDMDGTVGNRITVRAENERQAFIQGDGDQFVLYITNCSYWSFWGIRLASADSSADVSQGHPVMATNSDHLEFRRFLISNTNRYENNAVMLLDTVSDSLVEENEIYTFHRHGISTKYGDNNIIRRNYANSRLYADVGGGIVSDSPDRGDAAFVVYPGNNTIVENNISENNTTGYDIESELLSDNNQFLGNISLNDLYGTLLHSRENKVTDTIFRNFLVINPFYVGFYARAAENTQCYNCTIINSSLYGVLADKPGSVIAVTSPTTYIYNSLSYNNAGYGIRFIDQTDFGIDDSNSFGNGTNLDPASSANYTNVVSTAPGLAATYIFIPSDSPMKGAGAGGTDIGANILFRYEDGTLTSSQLWDTSTAQFTCGAIIAGVNDIADDSCSDVHERLNITVALLSEAYGGDALSEDFQSYTLSANLNGLSDGTGFTGPWVVTDGAVTIENSTCFPTKVLRTSATVFTQAVRPFGPKSGEFTVQAAMCLDITSPNSEIGIALSNSLGEQVVAVGFEGTDIVYAGAGGGILVSSFSANTPYTVRFNFDTVNHPNQVRIAVNNLGYGAWFNTAVSFTTITDFVVQNFITNAHIFAVDNISDDPGPPELPPAPVTPVGMRGRVRGRI